MNLFNKTSRKFLGMFIAIVAGSIAIAYMAVFFSPEARQERATADLLERYANDTYGGETPEETLSLFIKALEAGDVELASKYFVVEKQEEGLSDLKIASQRKNLVEYISILNGENTGTMYDNKIRYEINFFDKNNEQIHIEVFTLNTQTNKWKISEL